SVHSSRWLLEDLAKSASVPAMEPRKRRPAQAPREYLKRLSHASMSQQERAWMQPNPARRLSNKSIPSLRAGPRMIIRLAREALLSLLRPTPGQEEYSWRKDSQRCWDDPKDNRDVWSDRD